MGSPKIKSTLHVNDANSLLFALGAMHMTCMYVPCHMIQFLYVRKNYDISGKIFVRPEKITPSPPPPPSANNFGENTNIETSVTGPGPHQTLLIFF
jgi:hypothetical protein